MSKRPFDDNPSFWQIIVGMIIFIIFLIAFSSLLNERYRENICPQGVDLYTGTCN